MPVAAPAQWGRRLSDAIREALDAGDLASARRLALDGDGQARSLEKEYALMYRGLGITLRVLLNILGQMPVGDECGALLRRFREDMTTCVGRVYTSPGARRAMEGVPVRRLAPGAHIEVARRRAGQGLAGPGGREP